MNQPKDPLHTQLKRVHGQLGGIVTMYESQRECVDMVRQIVAVRSSLARVARDLLSSEASRCTRCQDVSALNDVLREVFKHT